MPEFLDANTKKDLIPLLNALPGPVEIILFTKTKDCQYCREQRQILEEISALSANLKLTVHDFDRDRDAVAQYAVDKTPATVIRGKKDYGIRFYGVCAGHEFTSLVESILLVSSGTSGLSAEMEKIVRRIDRPVHLEVMVTITCPYCPKSVFAANQLAMVSDNIRSDMIESTEFPDLARRYETTSVPQTMINGQHPFVGALPVDAVFLEIIKAIQPEEYRKIKLELRETRPHRHVRRPDPANRYSTIIVGGGPAALSAAVYTARKQLDVLLIADDVGGQLAFTASVENYLGFPQISGNDLSEQFFTHAEHYPIAEDLGSKVKMIAAKNGGFEVTTAEGQVYRGLTVIYCTGKEYRRLGVPGEEKFIGRGIAFCATCDAPLYKGKRVAVIGGGNSALTSVRDLLNFCQKVHLIHRRDTFRADPSLIEEVRNSKKVTFHLNTAVQEVLGRDRLIGLRLAAAGKKETTDLVVDGIFLEIGLEPNTEPVKDLVALNSSGEVPVTKNNATAVPGFYAAGDATDVPEKQIVIAAGEGAKAAISVYKYLADKKLLPSGTAGTVDEYE